MQSLAQYLRPLGRAYTARAFGEGGPPDGADGREEGSASASARPSSHAPLMVCSAPRVTAAGVFTRGPLPLTGSKVLDKLCNKSRGAQFGLPGNAASPHLPPI